MESRELGTREAKLWDLLTSLEEPTSLHAYRDEKAIAKLLREILELQEPAPRPDASQRASMLPLRYVNKEEMDKLRENPPAPCCPQPDDVLRELSEKATQWSPWSHDKDDARIFDSRGFVLANTMGGAIRSLAEHDANVDFIVACVNDVRERLAAAGREPQGAGNPEILVEAIEAIWRKHKMPTDDVLLDIVEVIRAAAPTGSEK